MARPPYKKDSQDSRKSPLPGAAATWRLIIGGESDGATNMAVDQASLESVRQGASPPTLRFYAWSPPCLSLGRSQSLTDVDFAACRSLGAEIVRRPTGGRGILHTDELTYSVSLLQSDPLAAGGVMESYRHLSQGLLAGLRRLGVRAVQALGQDKPAAERTAVCFETPSDYEITVDGRKLVGSAQWRARGAVLQHGTLPLCGDITRIVDLLALSPMEKDAQRQALLSRATTLEQSLGRTVPFAQLAQVLAEGFSRALQVSLVSGALSVQERALAGELRLTRYADLDWNART